MKYKEFFNKAKTKNINNIQIIEKTTIDSSVDIINGKLDSFDDYNNISYNIKAEYNNKTVEATTNYLSEEILDLVILKAENTDSKYEDYYLEKKDNIKKEKEIEFDISEAITKLKDLDKLRKSNTFISKMDNSFSENYNNTRIINSNGVDISTNSHLCELYVNLITEKDGNYTSYYEHILETDKKNIDFEKTTKKAISKLQIMQNKRKLETKKYNIILNSVCAGRLLSALVDMLSATNVRYGLTCFDDKLNKLVFSDKINIIEDPTNKKYPGFRLFDNEGTLIKKKPIIEKGVLKTFLYNNKEAKLQSKDSTGNGYNDIDVRNMYIVPGKLNEEEILSKLKDGLYITNYMGASTTSINTINGQISLQIFGFIVEDGKIVSGFEPSILTTTIFELFNNIEEIGNELVFSSVRTASPILLINNISIAR